MAHLFLDRTDDGQFSVVIMAGSATPKTKIFSTYSEADAFAVSKMGRSGSIVDTTRMSPEQLVAHKERCARAQALLSAI